MVRLFPINVFLNVVSLIHKFKEQIQVAKYFNKLALFFFTAIYLLSEKNLHNKNK